MPAVGRACWKCSGTLQAPAGSHPHSPAPGLPDQGASTMDHSSSQGWRTESWINGTAGRQDAAQLSASCAADPSLRCHGSRPHQAVLRVLPFTNKASTEPCTTCHHRCSHLAHPDPPGWIAAESNPHPVRFVLHSHPSTGVKAMATSKQSLEQLLALSSRAKASHAAASQSWLEPGCPAGTQSCHLHPPQTHQSRLGQSARHSLAPCL